MEQVTEALYGLLAAVLTALGTIAIAAIRRWAEAQQQRALALVQARLGEGAARVAGDIAGQVMDAPGVQAASAAMVQAGAEALRARYPETVARYGITAETLAGMVRGELGKLGVPVR